MSLDIKYLPLELDKLLECSSTHKAQGYRFLQMLCVNTDEGIDLQYSFMKDSLIENYTIPAVKHDVKVPSITGDFIAAFVFENEAHDLFGVQIENIAIDFGGRFYDVSVSEPMTVISPAQKEAREKAAKIAAAKAAKAASVAAAQADAPAATEEKGE
ncbi:MAG: NADH-quinone oxidoreductase subunit C [Raoultibacter sp.]